MPSKSRQKFSKMNPREHILHRPDTYIGSTRSKLVEDYVADSEFKITKKNIEYPPGILRIYVEALSNAIDNVSRSILAETPCTQIKINIIEETCETSIWNDGQIISVEED